MNNSIFTIRPFKKGSIWVFSEPVMNIFEEAFVGDVNKIIDAMLLRADLSASEPFTAMFSAIEFPGATEKLRLENEESGGHWYWSVESGIRGWFCPVLCEFFVDGAPKYIYVKAVE
jgi:hypothetical protein